MSRTYKDKPSKLVHGNYWQDTVFCKYGSLQLPTTKPKKRKKVDIENHWMTTPSWWTNLRMIRPERRAAHMLEKKALRIEDIEDIDFPDLGYKPHIYYF